MMPEEEIGRDTAPAAEAARAEPTEAPRDENPNRNNSHPRDQYAGKEKGKDVRSLARAAIKEVNEKSDRAERDGVGRFVSSPPKVEGRAPAPAASAVAPKPAQVSDTVENAPPTAPQAPTAIAAPDALSREVKAAWDTLPEIVKNEFIRREADTQKGVDQLKAKYKPIDDAFAPVRGVMTNMGKTEPEVITQLLNWHTALSGPHKADAFRALAKSHNFDLSTLGPQAPVAQQGAPQQQPAVDPNLFKAHLEPLNADVQNLKSELQRRNEEAVRQQISSFSADKPHFDRVRLRMGQMMNAGMIQAASPKEAFDQAYEQACRADPEVFALMQAEQTAKQEADAKAAQEAAARKAAEDAEAKRRKDAEAMERARKAGFGPRSGAPTGRPSVPGQKQGQSVRDTIKSAIGERGAAI